MARKKPSIDEYIRAGAYYRLWKEISVKSYVELSRIVQSVKTSDKISKVVDKVRKIETDAGLENCLQLDYPELHDSNFTSFFYGGISQNYSDVDKQIHQEMMNIIKDLFREENN